MKVAYFDCPFGAAGDMLLAGLVGAGVPVNRLLEELEKIDLPKGSFEVRIDEVIRCSILAKKVNVFLPKHVCTHGHKDEHEHGHEHEPSHFHPHVHFRPDGSSYAHSHPHGHSSQALDHSAHPPAHPPAHEHDQDPHARDSSSCGHEQECGAVQNQERDEQQLFNSHPHSYADAHPQPHRGLREILEIISRSKISPRAKEIAAAIFTKLGHAEAKVHGVSADEIHFHEVGAIDAIVDIVGFAIAYDLLGIEKSVVSPLPVGMGTVKTMHGLFPVPGPAVLELMQSAQAPVRSSNIQHECLTPTGCAILMSIADSFGSMPDMDQIVAVGYGAGSLDSPEQPNVVRIVVGETESNVSRTSYERFRSEWIAVLEANLDDFSPQLLANAAELLMENGALDVFVLPCVMKKGRSGHLLSVLCKPGEAKNLEEMIIVNTSSLGVRRYLAERLIAEREWHEVKIGERLVRVKVARDLAGKVINVQPEYEDCVVCATADGVPVKDIIALAAAKYKEQLRQCK
ncbi:MAG TPA: nickel pincer cofactor biosynthesis protein LarC [Candidatus Obscuribacterales bacterium]